MKLKTTNTAKKPSNTKINKSPKKQAKGVEVRKEKSKPLVKPTVLKKEAEKTKVEAPNPHKILQQELWSKAVKNVSNMSNLSDEESSIVKLLADYKSKSSIPQKSIKLKNFITKGFSKFKDTSDEILDGIYNKIFNEYKAVGGSDESKVSSKKSDSKTVKTKPKKEATNDKEMVVEDEENDDDDDDDDDGGNELDDAEGIVFDDSDDDVGDMEEESEEEKPKPKAIVNKVNNKNGKSQPNKGKNGSKFKGGKVQKNKKFGKKK